MVSRFRRTLSFPTKPNPTRPSPPEKSYHVRSISLPCRSHPLISQLQSEIEHLRNWEQEPVFDINVGRTSAWACDGLIRLKSLHDSVDDLLQLPHTQDSLRRSPDWVEKLLEDSIRFVDVYGIFRAALVALQEEQLALQMGVRWRVDESKMASYVKSRKKMDKEMKRLVSVVPSTVGRVPSGSLLLVDGNAELVAILRDVYDVTVSVTASVLNGISGYCVSSNYYSWVVWMKKKSKKDGKEGRIHEFEQVDHQVERLWGLRKRGGVNEEMMRGVLMGKLQVLENCIGGMESGSEGVFRSFISARVSLLNILTH